MTLKELADRLDVSVSAISLAINGKPGLSDETRSRILAEVESVEMCIRDSSRGKNRYHCPENGSDEKEG